VGLAGLAIIDEYTFDFTLRQKQSTLEIVSDMTRLYGCAQTRAVMVPLMESDACCGCLRHIEDKSRHRTGTYGSGFSVFR
jgi:hypothetical protein